VTRPLETAVVLVLEDAVPFDDVRRELAPDTELRGIPFHITLLYPFVARNELTDTILGELSSFFASRAPLEFSLTHLETFPSVLYAAPEPSGLLRECMRALQARFPDHPPYGGAFAEVIPHATLAEGVEAESVRPAIEQQLGAHLPAQFRIEVATLLEEFTPGRWRERAYFAFGG
jgi:2'-5' RNA ligase